MNQRKEGFYWVKVFSVWVVAYYNSTRGFWKLPGDGHNWYERNIEEIKENPIPPPTE